MPTELPGRNMKYCLVTYNVQAGEQAFTGQTVVGADTFNISIQDAIHQEFMEFFGEDATEYYDDNYWLHGDEYAVKISSMTMLEDTDAYVLMKYLEHSIHVQKAGEDDGSV